jgi:hypothetical protein
MPNRYNKNRDGRIKNIWRGKTEEKLFAEWYLSVKITKRPSYYIMKITTKEQRVGL